MRNLLITTAPESNKYDFIAPDLIKLSGTEILKDLTGFLERTFKINESSVIYIPTTGFTESTLSYSGVTIGLWIYIHSILKGHFNFHIVFIGSETLEAFGKLCLYSNIVNVPNVHYVLNTKHEFNQFLKFFNPYRCFKKSELVEALKQVNIEPPTAFKNAHTLTNEWCVYRWGKALGLDFPFTRLDKTLYFNYLKTILPVSPIPQFRNNVNLPNLRNGSILVIDDEIGKGWEEFFNALFPQKVNCLGKDFKKIKTREEIVSKAKEYVLLYDPDIVILDLRLHESDHGANPKDKLTGIKVLEEIKRINKGIQVIGFTASNKVWNLLKWQKFGIDDFIIKESPNLSVEENYTKNALDQLVKAIEYASEKIYLKQIFLDNKKALETLRQLKRHKKLDKDMIEFVTSYLNMAQSSLFADKPNYETAFMYYFLILEAFANFLIDQEGVKNESNTYNFQFRNSYDYLVIFDQRTKKKTTARLYEGKTKDEDHLRINYCQKLYNMIDYVGLTNIDPFHLVELRNKFNHPNLLEEKPIPIKQEDVINIKKVVCALINNYNN